MANEEETRNQYLAALQKQRQALNGNGSVLVNPSVTNDIDELAHMDTSFRFAFPQPVQKKEIEQITEDEETRKKNIWTDIVSFLDSVTTGVFKGMEGVMDFTLGIGSGIGKLFGADTTNLDNFIKTDLSTPAINSLSKGLAYGDWNDFLRGSVYIDGSNKTDFSTPEFARTNTSKVGTFLNNTGQTIGFMLPSIVSTYVSGGSNLVGLGTMGLGAGGQGTEQALQEGANIGQALAYGAATGGVEVVSEIVVGKALGKLANSVGLSKLAEGMGKVNGIDISGKIISKASATALAGTMIEEGTEEVFSDLLAPICQSIYKGTESFNQYTDGQYYKEMASSFVNGAIVGGIMSGTQTTIQAVKYGKELTFVSNEIQQVNELVQEKQEAMTNGSDTGEIDDKIKTLTKDVFSRLEKEAKENPNRLRRFLKATRFSSVEQFKASLGNTYQQIANNVLEQVSKTNADIVRNIQVLANEDMPDINYDDGSVVKGKGFWDGNSKTIFVNQEYASEMMDIIKHELFGHAILDQAPEVRNQLVDTIEKLDSEGFHNLDSELGKYYEGETLESERLSHYLEDKIYDAEAFKKIFSSTYISKSRMINLLNKFLNSFNKVKGLSKIDTNIVNSVKEAIKALQNSKAANSTVQFANAIKTKGQYTKAQYERYGWVNANNILTNNEYSQFNELKSDAKLSGKINKIDGFDAITTYDKQSHKASIILGKGFTNRYENYKINKIITFSNIFEESDFDIYKTIYKNGGINNESGRFIKEYLQSDLASDSKYAEFISSDKNNSRSENRRGTFREDSKTKKLARDLLQGRYTAGDNKLAITVKHTTQGYDIYEKGKLVKESLKDSEVKEYLSTFKAEKVVSESSTKSKTNTKPKTKKESKANYYREKAVLGKWVINGESRAQEDLIVDKFEGKYQVLNKSEILGEYDTIDEVKKYMEEAKATKYAPEKSTPAKDKKTLKVGGKNVIYSRADNGDILSSTLVQNKKGEYLIRTKNESTGELTETNFYKKYKEARAAITRPISATNNREDLFKKKAPAKTKASAKETQTASESKEYFKTVKTTEQIIRSVKSYIEGNADNKIKVAFPKNFDSFVSKTFTEINSVKSVELEAQKVVDLLLETKVRDYNEAEKAWLTGKTLSELLSEDDVKALKEQVVDLIDYTDTEKAKSKDTRPFEVALDRVIDKSTKSLSKTRETRILRGYVDKAKKNLPKTLNTTKESVARSGVDFLKLLVKDLHAKGGSTYSQEGVIENANAIRQMYDEIGKNQELYPDIPFYQEVIDKLDSIIDSIGTPIEQANGKVVNSHMTAKTERLIIEYAQMVNALSKQVKGNIIGNYKPAAIQTYNAINNSKYGERTNAISKLFRKYKRGFAPAYTVLREILGGNSRAAEILTTDYQQAQNNKILYKGFFSDSINEKLKELGLKNSFKKGSYTINGRALTTDQALGLYISLNVDANYQAIDESGIKYINENGRTTLLANKNNASALKDSVNKALPDNLKKFGDWLLETMNKDVKSDYIKWYEARFGKYNNRNEIGNIGQNSYWMLARAYNQISSVEKATTNPLGVFSNAKPRVGSDNAVMVGGALSGFTTYIDKISTELYLKPQYRDALAVLNTKIDGNNTVASLLSEKVDPQDRAYLDTTMKDMVGALRNTEDVFTGIMSRFSVAKLSLNIGSMLKQYASMWTSNIPMASSTRGLIARISNKEGYKSEYLKLIDEIGGLKYRESNSTVVAANATNLSGVAQKIADYGMLGISKVDKFTISVGIYSLMNIGENQYGYKIGSQKNIDFVKQQWNEFELSQIGNGALSRNALGRGDYGNLAKGLFGFLQGANRAALGSQINKIDLFSRNRNTTLAEVEEARASANKAVKEFENSHKNENGKFEVSELNEEDSTKYSQLLADKVDAETRYNDFKSFEVAGGKKIPLNMAAGLAAQGIFVTLINQLMKRIKGKKDWDEVDVAELGLNTALAIGVDWVPLVNTISSMIQGYDVQIPAVEVLSEMTDVLSSLKDGNWEKSIRELAVLIGDSTGIPFQTIYDYIYGAVKTFDVGAAYELNSVLYGSSAQSATKSLNAYVSKGNVNKANSMMKVALNSFRVNSSDNVIKEITSLYMDGEKDAMPKQFMTSYKDEQDNEVKLNTTEIKDFRAVYDLADKEVNKTILKAEYRVLTSAQRASILKKIYSSYYDYAAYKVRGVVPSSRIGKLLALTNGNVDLANYLLYLQKLDEITDSKTKTRKELSIEYINKIRGLNKNDKMLIMILAGYSVNEDNKKTLRNYLRTKGMSAKDANEFIK